MSRTLAALAALTLAAGAARAADEVDPKTQAAIQSAVEKAVDRAEKAAKTGKKDEVARRDALMRLRDHLGAGQPARTFTMPEEHQPAMQEMFW